MALNGERDGAPLRLGVTLGDTGTGLHCATGILAALLERERTGAGQRVEVSMQEAVANYTRASSATGYITNKPVRRAGSRLRFLPASTLYPCAGGGPNDYVYIAVTSPDMWAGVLRTIGREDLIGDADWTSFAWVTKNPDQVDAMVGGWTGERPKFEVMEAMAANGVPCSAVHDSEDVLASAHLRARGMVATVEHPVRGPMQVPGNPVRVGQPDEQVPLRPAPLLGEHTVDVLGEVLGLTAADLEELRRAGSV
jgi:formyl-CoA transferase